MHQKYMRKTGSAVRTPAQEKCQGRLFCIPGMDDVMKKERICSLSLSPAIDKTVFVDNFTLGEVNRASGACCVPGSKGVNVARILAKSGVPCVCFGFIGGAGGDYIIGELEKDGVAADFIKVDYDVRTNIKLVDLALGTYTDVNFDSDTPSMQNIAELKKKTRKLAAKSSLVALSGCVPPGADPFIYRDLALIAAQEGAKVSVDCCGAPMANAFAAKPFIIKPNLYELELTLGIRCASISSVVDAAMRLYRGGVENVLVSLGDEGAVAVCGGDVFRVHTHALPVYNTVGAGDAFLSGFLYGWHIGADILACLKYALSFSQARISMKPDAAFTFTDLTAFVSTADIEVVSETRKEAVW